MPLANILRIIRFWPLFILISARAGTMLICEPIVQHGGSCVGLGGPQNAGQTWLVGFAHLVHKRCRSINKLILLR